MSLQYIHYMFKYLFDDITLPLNINSGKCVMCNLSSRHQFREVCYDICNLMSINVTRYLF
jgi:hypothetical protein